MPALLDILLPVGNAWIPALLLLAFGGLTLVAGAEALVGGASRLALSLGVSPLVVGLTVVSMATSAPELAVSVHAALTGRPDLSVGNVVGSNTLNVLFVLGLAAIITPLRIDRQVVRQEVPIMITVSFLLVWLAGDGTLGRFEGALFLLLLLGYLLFLVRQSRAASGAVPRPARSRGGRPAQLAAIGLGMGLLVLGADGFVEGATRVARSLGVSELLIGLTVVALGTSLPEVTTSVLAALRGERNLAVGNAVGSNIFNILGCLGLASALSPTGLPIAASVREFDLPMMATVTVACLPIFFTGHRLSRREGGLFLAYYAGYLTYLGLGASGHAVPDPFPVVLWGAAAPLTALTIGILLRRRRGAQRRRHR